MDLHPDFRDLLAEFVRSGVSFVVVGGYAVGHHAKPRATKDLDLLVSGAPGNLARAATALEAFGAPPAVVASTRALGPTEVVYLGVEPVRVDVLRTIGGVETEAVIGRGTSVDLGGGLVVPVIALDDLIANKRAVGRPRDLADVALLERARAARR